MKKRSDLFAMNLSMGNIFPATFLVCFGASLEIIELKKLRCYLFEILLDELLDENYFIHFQVVAEHGQHASLLVHVHSLGPETLSAEALCKRGR
jgi:hypothetical protein